MLSKLLAGAALLTLAGSTLVYAQSPSGPGYGQPPQAQGPSQQGPGSGPPQDADDHDQQQADHHDDDDDDDDQQHAGNQPQSPGQGPYQQSGGPYQQSGPAYGYQPQQGSDGPPMGQQYGAPPQQDQQYNIASLPSAEDINAFVEGRLAAMRAGLKLNAEQTKSWTAFEQASRDLAKLEADRAAQMRPPQQQQQAAAPGSQPQGARPAPGAPAQQQPAQASPPNMFEELQRVADALTRDGAAFKRLADAGSALYKSLDDDQKRRFMELSHGLLPN